MGVELMRDEGQRLPPPNGRVIGAVDTKAELDESVAAIRATGFEDIEVLNGPDGIELMKRLRGIFFLGDEEASIIERNISELEQGHHIIAIHASSKDVTQVAEIAASHGVRSLTHFGMFVNTRFT